MSTSGPLDYQDAERCRTCRGKCCALYLPIFDPYDLVLDKDGSAHAEVYARGGDPDYCQY